MGRHHYRMGKKMTGFTTLTLAALAALMLMCLSSAFLIFHEDYEDGIGGRISLVLKMLGGGMFAIRTIHWRQDIDPAIAIFCIGAALFMTRHVYRFMRALHDPKYHWKATGKNTQMGDLQ